MVAAKNSKPQIVQRKLPIRVFIPSAASGAPIGPAPADCGGAIPDSDFGKAVASTDSLIWSMTIGLRSRRNLSSLLERLGVNLDQDHREVFVFCAALMRRAARNDYEIALLDFESLAIDDARTAPLAGIDLFWSVELSAQNQSS